MSPPQPRARGPEQSRREALGALLFLYTKVLHQDLGPSDAVRAKKPKRLPSVLTKEEIHRVLDHLSGTHLLMAHG
jgi:integrase